MKKYITGQDFTELQTIFSANIRKFKVRQNNMTITYKNDGSEEFCINQEFQFISGLSLPIAMYRVNLLAENNKQTLLYDTICVNKNEYKVKVEGQTARYRYPMDDNITDYFPFLSEGHETELFDLNYFFFNVYDEKDGTKWGPEKTIKEVKLNYILGRACVQFDSNSYPSTYWRGTYYFLDSNGKEVGEYYNGAFLLDSYLVNNIETEEEVYQKLNDEFIKNVDRTEILHECIVTPEIYKFNYLTGSYNDAWEVYKNGYRYTEDITYLTLFNTDSEEFNKIVDKTNNYNSLLTEKYQFGLVYGNSQGYPVELKEEKSIGAFGITSYEKKTDFYMLALSGVVEITYEEKGTIYKVSVSENQIDNSQANIPQIPEDDPWESTPGDPKPVDDDDNFWAWLLKIFRFFTQDIPNWFDKNKTAIIGALIAAGIIVACIFLWRFISPIITIAATKKAVEDAVKKKEE